MSNKKQTAVKSLINEILIEVDKYDDEGNVIGIDYWNAFKDCTSLLKYVNKAKELEKERAKEIWKASQENMHRQFSSDAYKPITFEQFYSENYE